MPSLKVLIVADELVLAKEVASYVEELGCKVCGRLTTGEQVLPFLDRELPDILLMSIPLRGKVDGISTAHLVRERYSIPLIYLTADTDDRSFERAKATQPFAFLEMPVEEKVLKRTFELLIEQVAQARAASPADFLMRDRIFVRDNHNVMVKVDLADILYIGAKRAYCEIHTSKSSHLITSSLSKLESAVSSPLLMRVHRSYLVNLRQIDRIEGNRVTIGSKTIAVSRSYWQEFRNRVKII